MQKFIYKAKTADGRIITGTVEAVTEKGALKLLHEKKLVVFSIKQKTGRSLFSFLDAFQGVSVKDVTVLTRQLATMINSGLTVINSLTIIQEQAKPVLAKVLSSVIRKIEGGSAFHKALAEHPKAFPKAYTSLIKSGETAGKLHEILAELADTMEKQEAFRRKVKGALIYPVIILIGMGIVSFIIMVYVVPQLTDMYKEVGTDLPFTTQILISVSTFVANFWYLVIIGVIALIYGFNRWKNTAIGREQIDRLTLKIPLVGKLMTQVVLAQVSRSLSMLITAGVPIIEALNIVADSAGNVIFEVSIKKAAKDVEKGLSLTNALEKYEEYPPLVIQMISVGEQTGKVGQVLVRVANFFEQEAEAAIKGLTTAIEPIMMLILGLGVGFIVISVITPIYNLTSQF